jgi:hypothetical protein
VDDDLDDELRRLFSDDRLDVHVAPDTTDAVVRGADRRRRRRSAVSTAFAVVALVGAGVALTQLPSSTENTAGELLPTSMPTSSSLPPPPSTSTVVVTTIETVNPPQSNPTGGNPAPGGTTGASPSKTRSSSVPPPPPPAEPNRVGKLVLAMSEADALATGSLIEPSSPADPEGKCVAYATTGVPDSNAVIISPARGIVRLTIPNVAKTQRGVGAGSKVADVKTAYPTATQNGSELLVEMASTPKWTYVFETDGTVVTTVRLRLIANDCPAA